MKLIEKVKGKEKLNHVLESLIYMCGYTIVLIVVNLLFKKMYIDPEHIVIWSFIIVFVLSILNKTIKPILVTLTIPITGLTLGLFYLCINAFILKIVDWLLMSHFELEGIFILILISIVISVMNFIMEEVIKSIIKKVKKHG